MCDEKIKLDFRSEDAKAIIAQHGGALSYDEVVAALKRRATERAQYAAVVEDVKNHLAKK